MSSHTAFSFSGRSFSPTTCSNAGQSDNSIGSRSNSSTSELFGKAAEAPQSETTPFYPRSPYGAAKLYGYWITINYREAYGIYGCNGILFNHESERRGETFVSRKITRVVSRIARGIEQELFLGNLDARRDWGHAEEYVEGMWRMLQQPDPDDYVLATGKAYRVRDFAERAFEHVDVKLEWQGEGVDEVGVDSASGDVRVRIDPRLYRPTEVDLLLGDASKAREKLGWEAKVSFEALVDRMMKHDLSIVDEAVNP